MHPTPSPVQADVPAPTDTAKSTPSHPPTWEDLDHTTRISSLGTVLYIVALLLAFPLYVVVVLTIHLTHPGQGLVDEHINVIDSFATVVAVVVTVTIATCVLWWLSGEPEGMDFCFDERQQCLTYTQMRPARAPTEGKVPYSAIHTVQPYKMTAFSPISHITMSFDDSSGKPVGLTFWVSIPDKDMAFHIAWLRESLGEKVQDVLDLDK